MKRGFNQGKLENAERARSADVSKRAERMAVTKAEGVQSANSRNKLLEQFALKDMVTDGTVVGKVSKLDTLRGEVVILLRTGKERRFSPEFVRKV